MKKLILNLIVALSLTLPTFAMSGTALAAEGDCPGGNTPQGQALQGIGESGSGNCKDSQVNDLIHTVVQILAMVAGAIGIIMVIVAGFKYITSGGDQQKVANAKGTLIYALVGIAIAALAEVLVHFVLFQANKVGS